MFFPYGLCKVFKSIYFTEHLRMTTAVKSQKLDFLITLFRHWNK